jgi:hypothetical protein
MKPGSFVFDQLELVGQALDRAEAFEDDCSRRVGFASYRIALSGMRSGTPGEPKPRDMALRVRGQAVLSTLAVGSPVHGLVRDILRGAGRNIREAAQEVEGRFLRRATSLASVPMHTVGE